MWKTIFVNLFSFTILTVSANAATELHWGSGTKDNPSYFSKAGITVSPTTDLTPYSNYATPDGENYFVLDQNITVQMFRSLWQSSNQHISMTDGSVLTIDTAPNGKDGYFSTIALRGTVPYGQNSMIFESGTVNIVNSARDTYNMSANIKLDENSTGANNKILTFESGTTLNSELSLFFFGANNSEYPERSVVNLNGALNTSVSTDGVVKYNSITLKGDDNNSIIVNFGEIATANIGKPISKKFRFKYSQRGKCFRKYKNSGIASENPNIQVDTNAVLNVNGNLKISATASTHAINVNGTVNVGKDASVYIKDGGYRNVQVFRGGTFDISSTGKDSVYVDDGFRLIGGKLVLRSEEALASTVIWLYSSGGTSTIDLYAAAHAKAFSFTDGSELVLNFNEGGSLWLDEFTVERGGGWANNLDEKAMLTLVNYSNYLLHVDSFREEDDLSRIFAEGFEEGSFRWEADTVNGGYWLVGTAVPEPAAVASVLGAFAFALAAYRRLK
ncbi:MAG: hypothetical protein ACLUKN_12320 [Bacilli bacterium]